MGIMRGLRRLALIVALMTASVFGTLGCAGEPDVPSGPAASPGSLAGQFLVATPRMADPRFAHSVILIIAHGDQGAMGLVVNRSYGEGPLTALLAGFGVKDSGTSARVRLHYGGPVEPERGFVLHSTDYSGPSTQAIERGLALSTGKDVLEAVAAGEGPRQAIFIIGYAGWGAGQLEGEIAQGDWLTAPGDSRLVFTADPDQVWKRAYRGAGVAL